MDFGIPSGTCLIVLHHRNCPTTFHLLDMFLLKSKMLYGSACSAWPTSRPDWTTPGKSRRCEMCAIGCAPRHKLTEQGPTGVFPQLAWQPTAAARSALLIHAPTDATAALVRRAKHCQQTWPDALSQRPTSTDSILSRNVD